MARSRDILERFRSAGTPGAAATPGVPADRVAEVSAELEPVLARLSGAQSEAARIRSEAEQQAAATRTQALDRAAALVAAARSQATADRAEAALRVSRAMEEENAAALAEAHRLAEAVRQRAAERMSSYLDRVLHATRSALRAEDEA
jgi:hypothetical protein